jgi:serine/threonine protein kinase
MVLGAKMISKLNSLSNLIHKLGHRSEASLIKKVASELQIMQLADRTENPTWTNNIRDIKNTDQWMSWVAADLAERLGLHEPAFLGASTRASEAKGAYAWSASNDAGESVVMKVIPKREVYPYKKIMKIKEEHDYGIIPDIYIASTFDELNYNPPVSPPMEKGDDPLSTMGAVVVMEELEKAPADLIASFTKDATDPNNFRILTLNDEELKKIIKEASLTFSNSLLSMFRSIGMNQEDQLKISADAIGYISENLYNAIRKKDPMSFDNGYQLWSWLSGTVDSIIDLFIAKHPELEVLDYDHFTVPREAISLLLNIKLSSTPTDEYYNLNIPGPKNLANALNDLRSLYIEPRDLNQDNIMLRPDTKEVVIADFGHFDFGLM